jgi:nicotinamidase-related amidase
MQAPEVDLAHSALLVVDMQNDSHAIAGHLVERLVPLVRRYQARGMPVVFTQHGHLPDDRGFLVRRWGPPGNGKRIPPSG